MVLVDCPSMGESTIAARIASISDGVVLIVDAGKTRWQVIKNQIREIQANRGSVLGVVLNKRKFYIPEFIYKRL
jgi:Mrp family chromosome partitioning ATPase